jgi:hypothetical protein
MKRGTDRSEGPQHERPLFEALRLPTDAASPSRARASRIAAVTATSLALIAGCATGESANGPGKDAGAVHHGDASFTDATTSDSGAATLPDGAGDDGANTDVGAGEVSGPDASDADASGGVSDATDTSDCTHGATCPTGTYCDPLAHACTPGCTSDADCTSSSAPHCDVTVHACFGCVTSSQCPSGQYCKARACAAGCDSDARCGSGLSCCTNACVDTAHDPMNCGGCGKAPAEVCNLVDDNCNGKCDEIAGCRTSVGRYQNGAEEFLTTSPSEGSGCCGAATADPYFWLYSGGVAGSLTALYRCWTGSNHLYTTDPGCEGASMEGVLGYIDTVASCGAVPLYRVDLTPLGEGWLETLDATERDNAASNAGTTPTTLGYVWTAATGS